MWIRFLDDDIAYVPMQWAWMNPSLVAISVATAIVAAMVAIWLTQKAQQGIHRSFNQCTAAVTLGGGIWAMHFVGMEAFTPCGSGNFSLLHSGLAIIPSLLSAGWVVLTLSNANSRWLQVITSGVVLALGVAVMHFWGMRASEATHYMDYAPFRLLLALALGVALSVFAVTVYRRMQDIGASTLNTALISGGTMGLAMAGMHYIAMDAIHLPVGPDPSNTVPLEGNWTPLTIAASVCLGLGLVVLAANIALRWRQLFREIQRSEARLRTVVDTAVDGIIMIEGNGSIVAFNPAAEQLLGWTSAEVIGRNVNTLMPAPIRYQHDGYLQRYLSTGTTSIIGSGREVQVLHKDGTLIDVRLAVGPVAKADKPLFIGFLTDLRQRNLMESSLRQSEEQYRTLISNIPGVTFRRSAQAVWTPLFLSTSVESLTGWSAEALLAQTQAMEHLLLEADKATLQRTVSEALKAGLAYACEYRLRHRDGGWRWVMESGRGVYDEHGQVQWIDGVLIDQTEAKARNAEFEGTVAAINRAVAVIEYDLDGHVLHANAHFLAMFGYTLHEVQDQHYCMFFPNAGDARDDAASTWQALQRGEHVSLECEAQANHHRSIWVNTSLSPILDANGKPIRITQLVTDVTASRTLAQALQVAKDKAEAAAAARSSFLANMSHEIRTPMNAIIGFTDALLETHLDPTQRRYMETVSTSSRSMLRLLNDILDTAKLDKGAVSLEVEDFSIKEVCTLVFSAQRLQAEKKGLQLFFDLSARVPPYLRGDALRIQQIVTNLMGNALKFTERGYVKLSVDYVQDKLHLRVQDTGIGIEADKLEHIFAPFAQADVSTTRRFGGTGLGTTISRQLAQLMGGDITVRSTPGQGTEFHVQLPLAQGAAPSKADAAHAVELPPLQILAADDVPQNLELLQVVLQRYGHQVHVAHNGLEAVQLRQNRAFDLILMDLQMPEMDGFEAAQAIRNWEAQHTAARIPIIALSASVLEQDRRASDAAGMDGFAVKPLEPLKLLQEIARVLPASFHPVNEAPPVLHAGMGVPEGDDVVDWQTGVQLWGSHAALRAAWVRFMAEQQHRLQELSALAVQQDAVTAGAIVHRMRGAAGNLALPQLYAVLGSLEQAARQQDMAAFDKLLPPLSAALAGVEALLSTMDATESPAQPQDGLGKSLSIREQPHLREDLLALVSALQTGEIHDAALQRLSQVIDAAEFSALQTALDLFDFDQALHCVQAWIDMLNTSLSSRNTTHAPQP